MDKQTIIILSILLLGLFISFYLKQIIIIVILIIVGLYFLIKNKIIKPNNQPTPQPNTQPTKNIYKGYINEGNLDNCIDYKNGDNNKECVKSDCVQGDSECHCFIRCMNDKG
jgi:hypothetical protein